MSPFALASLAGVAAVMLVAFLLRGRFYAVYAGVLLGLMSLIGSGMYGRFPELGLLREYLHAVTFVSFLLLVVPSMRPLPYRLAISIPAAFYLCGTLLAFPWALAGVLGLEIPLPWLPYAAAAIGVLESLWTRDNHDHEAPDLVRTVLAKHGIRLLVDEAELVDTAVGRVQILGLDHRWRDRHGAMKEVCAKHPKPEGVMRIVLLHDPGAFHRLGEGEGDLVLSGHTHGGQIGLVTLGLPWTFVSLTSRVPDHGLWARGTDRLYVHRGTGHYGFPLRVGVPAEQSLLQVHVPPPPTPP